MPPAGYTGYPVDRRQTALMQGSTHHPGDSSGQRKISAARTGGGSACRKESCSALDDILKKDMQQHAWRDIMVQGAVALEGFPASIGLSPFTEKLHGGDCASSYERWDSPAP